MNACHMKLTEAEKSMGAELVGADAEFHGVNTDSRCIETGQLFVALKGPNFDAHDFITQVITAGATAVVVERRLDVDVPQLLVTDTTKALGDLARAWRSRFQMPVIGVTGSNGKTTVKEMLASVLTTQWSTLSTKGNLNNDIGLPLTLFNLTDRHQAAVIEMGANHPDEIAYLTNIAQPTVALITNAGAAHLEGFGSVEGVAHAKGEIYQGLSNDGVAIFNADDQYAHVWRELIGDKQSISFAIDADADVSCTWSGDIHGSDLAVKTPKGGFKCHINVAGKHNVMNALTATAAALAVGIDLENIKQGLEAMRSVAGRLQTKPGMNGSNIIDDTYNANPLSLQAALNVLTQSQGEKFLALGDMGELGDGAVELHQQVGKQAEDAGVDALYAVGEFTRHSIKSFGGKGQHFSAHDDMIDSLRMDLHEGVTLLVKGSRSMHMEKIVEALQV